MNGQVEKLTIERFESLLEAYGGNLARWPARHILPAQGLLRASGEARARLAEAQALDRVLYKASGPDPERLRLLADRIIASAVVEGARRSTSPGHPASETKRDESATVIRLPSPRTSVRRASDMAIGEPPRARSRAWRQWPAAAALAASLLMGMAIGLTDVAQTTTLGVASLTGPSATDTEVVLSALQIDNLNLLDEDQI